VTVLDTTEHNPLLQQCKATTPAKLQ